MKYIFLYKEQGSFKKYVTSIGERGLAKKMTNCDLGGGGLIQRVVSFLDRGGSRAKKIIFVLV